MRPLSKHYCYLGSCKVYSAHRALDHSYRSSGLPLLQTPAVSHSRNSESVSPAFSSLLAVFVLKDAEKHGKYNIHPRRAKLGHMQTKQRKNYHCDSHHGRANEECWSPWDSLSYFPQYEEDIRKTQYYQDESKDLGQRQQTHVGMD